VDPEPLETACHLHRRAWSRGGGPWLGVGSAPPFEVVTTSHLAIDGYGHALLADRLFAEEDREQLQTLTSAAQFGLDAGSTVAASESSPSRSRLGIATADLVRVPSFAEAAYAMGKSLQCFFPNSAAFSPTFHVPIAPGRRNDPERRRRRVVPGLFSVHLAENFGDFSARVETHLKRDRARQGVLTRIARATMHAPLPRSAKRWLMAGGPPRRWLPVVETLSGRGCLSFLRFEPGDEPRQPLYAASYPALHDDQRGALVLTLVVAESGSTAVVAGTGEIGSQAGAQRFLETWQSELAAL
jgi:hypothetical protein